MKLSKFAYLVVFHFALVLFTPCKIDCKSYSHKVTDAYSPSFNISSDSLCSGVLGPNLLSIGDFGADTAQVVQNDPLITLGYDYQNAPPPDDGFYTITNDISDWGSFADLFWINIGDNSPDTTGYMMVINAHYEPGNFYKEIVSVCENTTYVFGADMINLTKNEIPNFILPSVDFLINGVTVASMADIAQDETWHSSEFSYTTGSGETSLVFVIRNSAPGGFGNDLALDNIFMKTCKGQVVVTQHETLCENGYLQATSFNMPDNFIAHYQWEYSIDQGATWQIISTGTDPILYLNNQPADAKFRCLMASGPNNFSLQSCYSTSNGINILFPSILRETYPSICDNEGYSINGNIYTETGIYEDTLTSFFGCDSIVVTNLEVLSRSNYEETIFICEDEMYDFHGILISETDQYKDTLINWVGCDSIITLDLVVLENSSKNIEDAACDTDPYFFNGELISTTGIYKDTLTSYNGCDSIVTLQLEVKMSYELIQEETICFGESYTFNGVALTSSGDYTNELTTENGCDSTILLSLEVLEKKENEINEVVCGSQNYIYNNITYSTTGIYYDTLVAQGGCDSILTLDLVFEELIEMTVNAEICEDESYFFKNEDLNEQGVYKDTLQSFQGCDSIVTLTLLKYEHSDFFLQQAICEDEVFQFGNEILTDSGIYTDTLINQNGCDSVLYLDLSVFPKYEEALPVTICYGESYLYSGVNYSTTGDYPVLFNSTNNCDSTILLQLTVESQITTDLQEALCDGGSFEMGGIEYSSTGFYQATLPAFSGCDSLVSLDLLVYQNEATSLEETICYGDSYPIGNTSYSENGTHITTLTSQYGCDSTVTLSLTVYQSVAQEMLTFCHGENYNGIDSDTMITIVESSYLGCDSIIELQLSFYEMDVLEISGDPVFCEGDFSILSVNNYDEYLWSNGATTPEVELTQSGIYEVTVWDENGCSISESIEVEMRSLDAEITYQNPSCNNSNAGIIQIEDVFGSGGAYQYSINGNEYSNNSTFFNLSSGAYTISIRDELGCDFEREILLEDPSEYEVSIGENRIIEYGDSTEIIVDSDSDIRIDTFYWFPEDGLSCLDCMTPVASPVLSTIYTLTIVTEEGCMIQDEIHINVYKPKDIYVPNIFSPNGDGQNEVFKIYVGKMVEQIVQFEIYDRWGEHVYSEAPNSFEMAGWDGTFKNEDIKQGVYIYYARIVYLDGAEEVVSGDVTLVR